MYDGTDPCVLWTNIDLFYLQFVPFSHTRAFYACCSFHLSTEAYFNDFNAQSTLIGSISFNGQSVSC